MPASASFRQFGFRFYEDGSEAGSTAIAGESVDISRNLSSNSNLHLRVGVVELTGGAGASTDDWQLQYSLNSGSYTNITTSSSVVKGFDSASLADGAGVSNRLTLVGVTFDGGLISEDGLADNFLITPFNQAEFLYSLTVISADVANNDTIDFRILRNGSVIAEYPETPRITVSKGGGPSRKIKSSTGNLIF